MKTSEQLRAEWEAKLAAGRPPPPDPVALADEVVIALNACGCWLSVRDGRLRVLRPSTAEDSPHGVGRPVEDKRALPAEYWARLKECPDAWRELARRFEGSEDWAEWLTRPGTSVRRDEEEPEGTT